MPRLLRSARPLPSVTLALLALGVAALLLARGEPAAAGGKERVRVPGSLLHVDDGDSVSIRWARGTETVRLLGIDTPEVQHLDHDLPYDQPFGREALGFLRGCLATADRVELLRSGEKDRYGRTLGYLLLDGRNYSVLAIRARLAYGPNPRFGDNGMTREHAACLAAAAQAGPPAFEEPWQYRKRMRALSAWLKEHGGYPACGEAGATKSGRR